MEEGKILFWIPGSQFVDWSTKARCATTCNCNCCSICEQHSRSQNEVVGKKIADVSTVNLYHLYSMYPLIRNIQMEFPHQVQQYRFKGQIIMIHSEDDGILNNMIKDELN